MGSPPEGEPEAGPWRVEPIDALVRLLLERAPAERVVRAVEAGRAAPAPLRPAVRAVAEARLRKLRRAAAA
ncbi:MAG TPA: hypothetical protein VF109_09585, partial [Mycobacteriales bacterium]